VVVSPGQHSGGTPSPHTTPPCVRLCMRRLALSRWIPPSRGQDLYGVRGGIGADLFRRSTPFAAHVAAVGGPQGSGRVQELRSRRVFPLFNFSTFRLFNLFQYLTPGTGNPLSALVIALDLFHLLLPWPVIEMRVSVKRYASTFCRLRDYRHLLYFRPGNWLRLARPYEDQR